MQKCSDLRNSAERQVNKVKQKELHRLGKGELIDIIYEQKKIELDLKSKLSAAKEQLDARNLTAENAGSLAEAALGVNKFFEAAQRAADDYVRQVHADYSEIDLRCKEMTQETEEKCQRREAEADRLINEKWDLFNRKIEDFLMARAELSCPLPQSGKTNGQEA